MARGQTASQGRVARSEGLPTKGKMTKSQAEDYLIKNANRGYPANKGDLDAMYAEEKYEMGANGMRAPSYGKWLEERVARTERAKARADAEAKLKATPEGEDIEKAYKASMEKFSESLKEEDKARNNLEMAVREVYRQNLSQFRFTLVQQSLKDGTPVGTNKDLQERFFKERFPNEYEKLEKAISNREKARETSTEIADRRRKLLDGREEPKAQEGTGRVARSETPVRSAYNPDTQKIRNQAIIETLERKDLTQAQKAYIASEITKGFRDKQIGLG